MQCQQPAINVGGDVGFGSGGDQYQNLTGFRDSQQLQSFNGADNSPIGMLGCGMTAGLGNQRPVVSPPLAANRNGDQLSNNNALMHSLSQNQTGNGNTQNRPSGLLMPFQLNVNDQRRGSVNMKLSQEMYDFRQMRMRRASV